MLRNIRTAIRSICLMVSPIALVLATVTPSHAATLDSTSAAGFTITGSPVVINNASFAEFTTYEFEYSYSTTTLNVLTPVDTSATVTTFGIRNTYTYLCDTTANATTFAQSFPKSGDIPTGSGCGRVNDSSSLTNRAPNIRVRNWVSAYTYCRSTGYTDFVFITEWFDSSGNKLFILSGQETIDATAKATATTKVTALGSSCDPSNLGLVGSSSGSGSSDESNSSDASSTPSPKIPAFNQFANGPMLVTAGVAATLTGNRLGCTTEIQINDVATTFTRSYLGDGTQQLNIAIPTNLQPGRHKMSMDSCGGQVEFSNLLVVPKAPAVFEMVTRNSIERGLALARLQSFLLTNMNDYNSVECIVNVKAPNLQTAARQLLADACNRAVTMLRATSSTSELRNTHLPTNIWIRITLSNK